MGLLSLCPLINRGNAEDRQWRTVARLGDMRDLRVFFPTAEEKF